MKLHHKTGFTLIELLVVVLIMGILAAIALAQYQKAVEKSRSMEAITILKTLRNKQELCFLEHGQADQCMQGNEELNLFTVPGIEINLSGAPDPDCGSAFCGPTSADFSYELDGQDIFANRKPVDTKYYLTTTALILNGSPNEGKIVCFNSDENKNWCHEIGFTKKQGNAYMRP